MPAKAYAYGKAGKSSGINLATVDLIYSTEYPNQNLKNMNIVPKNPPSNKIFSEVDKFFEKVINRVISTFSS